MALYFSIFKKAFVVDPEDLQFILAVSTLSLCWGSSNKYCEEEEAL